MCACETNRSLSWCRLTKISCSVFVSKKPLLLCTASTSTWVQTAYKWHLLIIIIIIIIIETRIDGHPERVQLYAHLFFLQMRPWLWPFGSKTHRPQRASRSPWRVLNLLTLRLILFDSLPERYKNRQTNKRHSCDGYNYDSTLIQRPFDGRSKVIKVTVT